MEITLQRSLGSHKAGKVINVDKRLARVLVATGRATENAASQSKPRRIATAPQEPARIVSAPQQQQPSELNALLKSQLVEIANGLGITLDGSETKADLITMVERARRRIYARRDMQAGK